MSRRKPRRKENVESSQDMSEAPIEEETSELPIPQPTPRPTQETTELSKLHIEVYCSKCEKQRRVTKLSIDHKGCSLFHLECGHVEAFEFRVIAYGDYAVQNFGK